MTRVFRNIFSNGFYAATRRARSEGDSGFVPTLKVTTTRDAGEVVEIRVRDNGDRHSGRQQTSPSADLGPRAAGWPRDPPARTLHSACATGQR